jgi:hypothetical protein
MQDAASVLTEQFSEFLVHLPVGLDLDSLAPETKAIQRRRELVDGASLLRLALARGPGGFSLRQTLGWASLLDVAELSNPAVQYRLKQGWTFSRHWSSGCWRPRRQVPIYAGPAARFASRTAPVSAHPAAKVLLAVRIHG